MMAKPIRALELHYPMILFIIKEHSSGIYLYIYSEVLSIAALAAFMIVECQENMLMNVRVSVAKSWRSL